MPRWLGCLKSLPVEFNGQLKTTAMFYTAESAVAFTTSQELKDRNATVRQLVFANGMMDEKITSADFIGIQYPDGTVHGDAKNVLIRYDATFMSEAKDGKLSN
jgi:NitT/TauT family transport system substrate-binding protein